MSSIMSTYRAGDRLMMLLREDAILKPLYQDAISKVAAEKLERNLRRLPWVCCGPSKRSRQSTAKRCSTFRSLSCEKFCAYHLRIAEMRGTKAHSHKFVDYRKRPLKMSLITAPTRTLKKMSLQISVSWRRSLSLLGLSRY